MLETTKLEIETLDFHQEVKNYTRTWKDQDHSLIDQVWMNKPEGILQTRRYGGLQHVGVIYFNN